MKLVFLFWYNTHHHNDFSTLFSPPLVIFFCLLMTAFQSSSPTWCNDRAISSFRIPSGGVISFELVTSPCALHGTVEVEEVLWPDDESFETEGNACETMTDCAACFHYPTHTKTPLALLFTHTKNPLPCTHLLATPILKYRLTMAGCSFYADHILLTCIQSLLLLTLYQSITASFPPLRSIG